MLNFVKCQNVAQKQINIFDIVPHLYPAEGEGILAQGVGGAFQPIHNAVVVFEGDVEVHVAGKSVLTYFVSIAQMAVFVLPYTAYGWEEHRRSSSPEFGIALPQVFFSVFLDALKLGSVLRNLYGKYRI